MKSKASQDPPEPEAKVKLISFAETQKRVYETPAINQSDIKKAKAPWKEISQGGAEPGITIANLPRSMFAPSVNTLYLGAQEKVKTYQMDMSTFKFVSRDSLPATASRNTSQPATARQQTSQIEAPQPTATSSSSWTPYRASPQWKDQPWRHQPGTWQPWSWQDDDWAWYTGCWHD